MSDHIFWQGLEKKAGRSRINPIQWPYPTSPRQAPQTLMGDPSLVSSQAILLVFSGTTFLTTSANMISQFIKEFFLLKDTGLQYTAVFLF